MSVYKDRLDALWVQHQTTRAENAPTVVSAFAGAGGSSLGYSAAGYRELLAIEWDAHAVSCLRRNFPDVPIHHGDITEVDPDILDISPGELDVFDGSPPCQGFSTAGKRQIDDPRNQLFREYVRLLEAWQPKTFVMENVSGMIKGRMRLLFTEILTTLKTASPGYKVVARLLDASLLGVAQTRKRLIFVGVRQDLGCSPVHPVPFTRPPTFREATEDIDDPGLTVPLPGKLKNLAPLVPPGQKGSDALTARGGRASYYSLIRAHWNQPCPTITKSMAPSAVLHPVENRFLSSREVCRVQGFPDAYDWGNSTLRDIWARVGNSVPPSLMYAVASTVRDHVLDCSAELATSTQPAN